MHIEKKEKYIIIKPTKTIEEFYDVFIKSLEDFKENHLILNFSEKINTSLKEVLLFLDIATEKRENGTSFVIIVTGIDIDEIPDELNIVPTITEAIDVLEMDAIERDLMDF